MNPIIAQPTFLEYPNLQEIMESANNLLIAIIRYRDAVSELFETVEKRYSKEHHAEAKKLYNQYLIWLDDYIVSYQDILSRETNGKESSLAPFFKNLGGPISQRNPHISFDMKARFKSWISFVQKAITLLESKDDKMLETFYDMHGCKITVHTHRPLSVVDDIDYPTAEAEVYEMCKSFITYLKYSHADDVELLPTKDVGETSELIPEEYRQFVKDYFMNPKENGYRALHVAFRIKLSKKRFITFEAQFNTALCELNSQDGGPWSHIGHKENTKIPVSVDYNRILYKEFMYTDKSGIPVFMDSAGVLEPKALIKKKTYQAIV